MLINFKNGLVLDILPSRHKSDLRSYFRMIPEKEKLNVEYITMDLYDNYRDIAYHWLPINANIRMYRNDHLKMYKVNI